MNNCIFCNPNFEIAGQTQHFVLLYDQYPVTIGHILIVCIKHRKTYLELTTEERVDLIDSIDLAITITKRKYPEVCDFNVGWNNGPAAGQVVEHFHCHLIPRRLGDVNDPTGGVRGVIPERQNYKNC